jgi:FPC/CPF motif-containing protein YcgG
MRQQHVHPDVVGRRWNPLHRDFCASARSSYLALHGSEVIRVLDPDRDPTAAEMQVAVLVRELLLSPGYPCVGARSVLRGGTFRFGCYPPLGTDDAVLTVCHDLYEFGFETTGTAEGFTSFMAVFSGPSITSEAEFERLLWAQLQTMHDVDAGHFAWDASVSRDPHAAKFSFSIGRCGYFVIGMHPHASRLARQFDLPALVFNPDDQFRSLDGRGQLDRFKRVIRARDTALQGSINPMLLDSPTQARQYSGRQVTASWRCPLRVKPDAQDG